MKSSIIIQGEGAASKGVQTIKHAIANGPDVAPQAVMQRENVIGPALISYIRPEKMTNKTSSVDSFIFYFNRIRF